MKKTGKYLIAILVVVILLSSSSIAAPRDGRKFKATYYSGAVGACSKLTGNYIASKFYKCGQHLTLKHNGETVNVTVRDRCQCGVDMAPHVFKQFAPLSQGIVTVRVYKGWNK